MKAQMNNLVPLQQLKPISIYTETYLSLGECISKNK